MRRCLPITALVPVTIGELPSAETLQASQRGFGYSREDVKMILEPMAKDGKDPVWSMGDDTALAFLAKTTAAGVRLLSPAVCAGHESVDRSATRGMCGIAAHAALVPGRICWTSALLCPGCHSHRRFFPSVRSQQLRQGAYPQVEQLRMLELQCLFAPEQTLEEALDELCERSIVAVREGARILLQSDRGAHAGRLPITMGDRNRCCPPGARRRRSANDWQGL